MPIEVTMPKLSPTMETGVIAQWLKKVGDTVKEGDALADIETDKATMQMKSYDDGTIAHIDHAAGDEVALGQRVLVLAKKGEDPKEVAAKLGSGDAQTATKGAKAKTVAEPAAATSAAAHSADNGQQTAEAEPPQGHAAGGRVKSSPLARKVAAAASLDIGQLSGTGPGGRIIRRDVEQYLQKKPQPAKAAAAPASARGAARRTTLEPRPHWRPSAFRTRGCERPSPSACRRPSRRPPRFI